MPELLWKAYIDFEVEEGERLRARALYERLTGTSGHWKVWVAYAMFEAQPIQPPRDEREEDDEDGDEGDEEKEPKMVDGDLEIARQVFQRGYKDLKTKGLKNEVSGTDTNISGFLISWHGSQRVALLQVWKSFEEQRGTADDAAKVEAMMPVQGKRRYVDEETGQLVEGMFPYVLFYENKTNHSCADYDYIFADDEREANPTSYKFLQMAHAWAAAKKAGGTGGGGSGPGGPAQSRFTAALDKDDHDTDDRAESDGVSEPMDEDADEASVASSHGDS